MRNTRIFLLIILLTGSWLTAQVKIGDNPQNIDPASVLELESTDKVLVITRVTTAQMNAIVPSQGALCYNTDLQTVHYYDGTQWLNIGNGGGPGNLLTADPIVNPQSTIVITPTADGNNVEVAPNSIRSEQIVDGGVNGVDIQDGSIGPGKLQNNSVTEEKLSENSVGTFALDNDNIGVSAFNNDAGYLIAGDINIVSADPGNVLETRTDGVFYNDQPLITAINQNTDAIALDGDTNALNEIQNLMIAGDQLTISGSNTITLPAAPGADGSETIINTSPTVTVAGAGTTLSPYVLTSASGTDDQNLETPTLSAANVLTLNIEGGNPATIDLSPLAGTGGTDDQNLETPTLSAANVLTLNIEGGNPTTIDLSPLAGAVGTDDQTAAEVAYDPTTSGLTATDTQAAIDEIAAAGGSDDQTAAEVTYDPTTSGLTATDTQAAIDEIVAADISNEQDIALDTTDNEIDLLEDDGTTVSSSIKLDGTTIEAINNGTDDVIQLADDAVALAKIDQNGAANGDVLKWDDDGESSGVGGWVTSSAAAHFGTENSIFFADDVTGAPTEDNNSFAWNPTIRLGTGQLQIGLEGNTAPTDVSKVVIAETPSGGADVMYPLLIQTSAPASSNASTGILFSPETHGPGTLAKGALIYQRTGDWAIGDFHFLQTSLPNLVKPTTADKAFTIKNNKDIVIYGGIEINGAGLGMNGQVLSSTGTGVQWINAGGGTVNVNAPLTGDGDTTPLGIAANGITATEIANDAISTIKVLDNNITPTKIAEGANGEVLTTDASGDVIWAAPAAGTVSTDTSIGGDGNVTPLTIANNAITTARILDNNVTIEKITEGANGEVLTTDASGDVIWAAPAAGAVSTDTSIGGDGNVTPLTIANNAITTARILDGQVTGSKMAVGSVQGSFLGTSIIVAGTIGTADIGDNAIGSAEIQNSAVKTGEIEDGTIENVDISVTAAIDGSKVIPIFLQNVETTGVVISGGTTMTVPDYVFQKYFLGNSDLDKNYNFQELEEVEAFIKKHHHLPGIKSIDEVKKEGTWNLSESNLQNLEKIEELFLHTIEQEKKIKTLQTENESLKGTLKSMQESIQEIKILLETKG